MGAKGDRGRRDSSTRGGNERRRAAATVRWALLAFVPCWSFDRFWFFSFYSSHQRIDHNVSTRLRPFGCVSGFSWQWTWRGHRPPLIGGVGGGAVAGTAPLLQIRCRLSSTTMNQSINIDVSCRLLRAESRWQRLVLPLLFATCPAAALLLRP